MRQPKYTEEDIRLAVQASTYIAQVLEKLGLVPAGCNYATIKRKLRELNINTEHFTQQRWRKGCKVPFINPRPLDKILVDCSDYPTHKLKRRLLSAKLKQHRCEICGLTVWQGQPIPLELHHANGRRTDNRFDNLQLVCPNCHALAETYRGKNKRLPALR